MLKLPIAWPALPSCCPRKRKIPTSQSLSTGRRPNPQPVGELGGDGSRSGGSDPFAGIGEAIASAIRGIVTTGTLGKLEKLRAQTTPAIAGISSHPRLV